MHAEKAITLRHLMGAVSALLNKISTKASTEDLSDVAFTGDYGDLNSKPDLGSYMVKGTDYVTAGLASNVSIGDCATAEGYDNYSEGDYSHAEGHQTAALGESSHAEGYLTQANGDNSHAEGYQTQANGDYSHAEGSYTKANGYASHAEGGITIANGYDSHAEGYYTQANGDYSHAEGYNSSTYGNYSHAEGQGLTFTISFNPPSGTTYPIFEGKPSDIYQNCPARILGETAEITGFGVSGGKISSITFDKTLENSQGYRSLQFYGTCDAQSHSEGLGTIAYDTAQHAGGKYNIPVAGAEVIGGGTASTPANIRTLDWNGNETLAGNLTVQGGSITLGSWTISIDGSGNMTILPAS